MLGLPILDVAIGLIFAYLVLSLVTAAKTTQQTTPSAASPTPPMRTVPPGLGPPGAIPLEEAADKFSSSLDRLNNLPLPLGWVSCPSNQSGQQQSPCQGQGEGVEVWPGNPLRAAGRTQWAAAVNNHFLGWLMTALAISLGAPFWFDMLNKVLSIRSAGKAPEEQQKEPKKVPQPQEPGKSLQGGVHA